MKLSRRTLRRLIENSIAEASKPRKKQINEAFGVGFVGAMALSVLAIAGIFGASYLGVNALIDAEINRDPRVKQKLEELGELVSENPEMKPADVARMAAQSDPELAAIIQEIELKVGREVSDVASGMPTFDHTGAVDRARDFQRDISDI